MYPHVGHPLTCTRHSLGTAGLRLLKDPIPESVTTDHDLKEQLQNNRVCAAGGFVSPWSEKPKGKYVR